MNEYIRQYNSQQVARHSWKLYRLGFTWSFCVFWLQQIHQSDCRSQYYWVIVSETSLSWLIIDLHDITFHPCQSWKWSLAFAIVHWDCYKYILNAIPTFGKVGSSSYLLHLEICSCAKLTGPACHRLHQLLTWIGPTRYKKRQGR